MLCQECNKRQATVHLTQIVNNKKSELHICEKCAAKHSNFMNITPFSINDLLASFMDFNFNDAQPSLVKQNVLKCGSCGMEYSRFKKIGRVGCKDCYKYFINELRPILGKFQGKPEHTGKVPKKAGIGMSLSKKIQELKTELKKAVDEEAYEQAAVIRDKIKEYEIQLKNEEKKGEGLY